MSISNYVSGYEVDARTCADAYKEGDNKFQIVKKIVDEVELGYYVSPIDIAWLIVEAIDAYEDTR